MINWENNCDSTALFMCLGCVIMLDFSFHYFPTFSVTVASLSVNTKVLLGVPLSLPFLQIPTNLSDGQCKSCLFLKARPGPLKVCSGRGWTLARRHLLLNNICSCYSLSPSMPRDTQALPRVAFCVPHCQFHHCLLKSVPIMPRGYKPQQRPALPGWWFTVICV